MPKSARVMTDRKALHVLGLYQGIDIVFECCSIVEFEMGLDARPSNQSSIHAPFRCRLGIGDVNHVCCPSTRRPSQVMPDFGLSDADEFVHSFREVALVHGGIVAGEVRFEKLCSYRLTAQERLGDRVIELDVVSTCCTIKQGGRSVQELGIGTIVCSA